MLLSPPTMSSSLDFSLSGILSETNRVVSAHFCHFLALSVIFLLPGFSPVQVLLSHNTASNSTALALRLQPPPQPHTNPNFLFLLPFALLSFFLYLCAVGTITHSVTNAFFGRPIKLAASLSSLLQSFLPLLLTSLASKLRFIVISSLASLVFAVGIMSFHLLVSEIDYTESTIDYTYSHRCFKLLCLLYFQVNWALAQVVVVMEKTWGFEPLKRSTKLVQGKKLIVLSYLLFFGRDIGLLTWLSSGTGQDYYGDGSWKAPVQFVIKTILVTALRVMVIFCSLVAESVMYLYCKAVKEELAGEAGKGFGDGLSDEKGFDDQRE